MQSDLCTSQLARSTVIIVFSLLFFFFVFFVFFFASVSRGHVISDQSIMAVGMDSKFITSP